MKKEYLNIDKIPDIKTLWHAAWLFTDVKDTEIVLQVTKENYESNNPVVLQVLYLAIAEGLLNSKTSTATRKDFESKFINDYNNLVTELQALTGRKFSIEVKE